MTRHRHTEASRMLSRLCFELPTQGLNNLLDYWRLKYLFELRRGYFIALVSHDDYKMRTLLEFTPPIESSDIQVDFIVIGEVRVDEDGR